MIFPCFYGKIVGMRKRIKPVVVLVFLSLFGLFMAITAIANNLREQNLLKAARQTIPSTTQTSSSSSKKTTPSSSKEKEFVELKPIIDVSGWQLPSEMDYDTLSQNISAVIVRVYGGSQITKHNAASHTTGLDKSYKTHIQEFQKRNIPVAVYAYALGASEEEMREEAREFYKAASPYNPTYYWVDVEEETMTNMDLGVQAFQDELRKLGAKKVGLYIGTYFIEEQQISANGFDAIWIPTYGANTGYYDAAPQTDLEYHLHQYTDRGWVSGFDNDLDLNQIAPTQDTLSTFEELFNKKLNTP